MAIIRDEAQFEDYLLGTLPSLIPSDVKARYPNDKTGQINTVLGKNPLLFDRYLSDAIEVDVDCLCDGKDVFIAGIMEHIEEAGIHSGDSACSLPPRSLSREIIAELERQTKALALALNVGGLMNVQYAIKDGDIYVLEVNPRASRTVPFVAKVIGEPIAKIAARIMAGESLASFGLSPKELAHIGVKEAVFPFARFPGVDVLLGPEMRSTGEVIGLDRSFGVAFAKSQLGSGTHVPKTGSRLRLGARHGQGRASCRPIQAAGRDSAFTIVATGGTQRFLEENGVKAERINKVLEGRPHVVDAIKNGDIQLVFNTTEGAGALSDSRSLRQAALLHKVPYYTTLAGRSRRPRASRPIWAAISRFGRFRTTSPEAPASTRNCEASGKFSLIERGRRKRRPRTLFRTRRTMDKVPLTIKGHAALEEELKQRQQVDRPRIIQAISEARALGDLSENAEYHAAKEAQSLNEGRVLELESLISRAEVIDVSKLSGDRIKFGAIVKLVDEDTEEEKTYQIVGEPEADVRSGRVSISSRRSRAR